MLFYQKQHVIRSISRDIFQIKSDEISFSSDIISFLLLSGKLPNGTRKFPEAL